MPATITGADYDRFDVKPTAGARTRCPRIRGSHGVAEDVNARA
jgi:hypothetical protein